MRLYVDIDLVGREKVPKIYPVPLSRINNAFPLIHIVVISAMLHVSYTSDCLAFGSVSTPLEQQVALARVLVADDSAMVHIVMGRLLSQLGYSHTVLCCVDS